MKCRHCGGTRLVKFGIVYGKQRYKCKECGRTTRANDARIKYSQEKKLKVLAMYLKNNGIRSIERLEGVSSPLIIRWIRQSAKLIYDWLKSSASSVDLEKVAIIELDELYSFVKKKATESSYGLLWIGTSVRLLILRSL